MTSLTSTLVIARKALVAALDTGELAGKVHYAWPGPDAAKQFELLWVDRVLDWSFVIPTIKAGRKQRQESFTLELVLWVPKPDVTSADAVLADERAVELMAVVDSVLADDVQAAEDRVQWLFLGAVSHELVPYGKGWACQILLQVQGQSRLT